MTDTRSPSGLDFLDSLLPLATGIVLAAPMLPGFVLTVPALLLATVVVLVPVVVIAALVALAAIPFLIVRAIRAFARYGAQGGAAVRLSSGFSMTSSARSGAGAVRRSA